MGGGYSIKRPKTPNYLDNLFVNFVLGTGGYSTVLHGIDKQTQQSVAVKKINLTSILEQEQEVSKIETLNTILMELEALKRVTTHHQPSSSGFNDNNHTNNTTNNPQINNNNSSSPSSSFKHHSPHHHHQQQHQQQQQNHEHHNQFIVNLHMAFKHHSCCYLIMDCLNGGDLRHFLKINGALTEQCVIYIVACIGSALHHCHSHGVIHRDIKPENIGLNSIGVPFLMDFGIAIVSTPMNPLPLCMTSSGTLPYLAPEILQSGNCHSYQVDYWSLGVMAFELLFNYRPFIRHCPKHCIQFVANEFSFMWLELQKKTLLSNSFISSTSSHHFINETHSPSHSRITSNFNSLSNSRSQSVSSHFTSCSSITASQVDFEAIYHQCQQMIHNTTTNNNSNEDSTHNNHLLHTPLTTSPTTSPSSEWKLPFPNLSLHLNEDGSLPSSLMISFPESKPPSSPTHQPPSPSTTSPYVNHPADQNTSIISEECQSLFRGLIDVRIPSRLGDLTRYHEFSHHPCFLKYGYLPLSHLPNQPLRSSFFSSSKSHLYSPSPALPTIASTASPSSPSSALPSLPPLSQLPSPLLHYSFDILPISNVTSLPLAVVEPDPFSDEQMKQLPLEIQQKLSQYYYQNPSRSASFSRKSNNDT